MSDSKVVDSSKLSIVDAAAGPSGARRLLAFLCADVPVEFLARAQRSQDWAERAALAMHPRTPPLIIERLACDGNAYVRALAREVLENRGG